MNNIPDDPKLEPRHPDLPAPSAPARAEFAPAQGQERGEVERKQSEELGAFEHPEELTFVIKIDRPEYRVHKRELTGLELRHVPQPPIGPERDLFEVVPGGSDVKIANDAEVKMRNGLRFFTAPAQINPGALSRARQHATDR
jgi:hypothetical protein